MRFCPLGKGDHRGYASNLVAVRKDRYYPVPWGRLLSLGVCIAGCTVVPNYLLQSTSTEFSPQTCRQRMSAPPNAFQEELTELNENLRRIVDGRARRKCIADIVLRCLRHATRLRLYGRTLGGLLETSVCQASLRRCMDMAKRFSITAFDRFRSSVRSGRT